jgi:hypothetical protein
MFSENFKNFLLSGIPTAKVVSGGSHVACRCFECGDSKKDSRSKHLYISMPTDNDPPLYYCHLCNCSGVVTYRKLIDWGIYDPDIATDLLSHYIGVGNSSKVRSIGKDKVYYLRNDYMYDDYRSHLKMTYINNRLGTNLQPEDFMRLKVVMNLHDILEINNITTYTREISIVNDLDRAFVGFLSLDNGFIIFRKLDDELVYKSIDHRYVNYRIFDKEETSQRFYVVPQAVDLLSPYRIKLHIAEGVFDILSIYLNVRKQEPGIYSTVCGSNYSSIISYFMIEKQIPNLEIHLYPDNDQPNKKMKDIVDKFNPYQVPIYIHRNISPHEKDFGVSSDRIVEVVEKANIWI